MNRVLSGSCFSTGPCDLVIGILSVCRWTNRTAAAQDQPSAVSRRFDLAEVGALIDRAEQALRTNGSNVSAILSHPRYLPVHAWPRFRNVIKAHSTGSSVTNVTLQEPGTRRRLRMRLVEADGSASVGTLVYS